MLNNIVDGFHGTIMAYGQTSSGKTHTMQGYEASDSGKGIMPRMVKIRFYLDLASFSGHLEIPIKHRI